MIVEAPLPHFDRPAFMCTREWYRTDYTGCSVARAEFEKDRHDAMTALNTLTAKWPNVELWDPSQLICAGTCDNVRGNTVLFRDANHLSYSASRQLGPAFTNFLDRIR